ncbi:MAG: hypothetical protein WDN04_09990 [Rhodospirillales bacterium]
MPRSVRLPARRQRRAAPATGHRFCRTRWRRAAGHPALHARHLPPRIPILDGIPVITPPLRRHLSDRAVELLVRDDIDPDLEGLFGDAMGPDSWFDVLRQTLSTYGWDAYADQDPREPPSAEASAPGAARRCLQELLRLAPPTPPISRVLDLGCAGRPHQFRTRRVLARRPGARP